MSERERKFQCKSDLQWALLSKNSPNFYACGSNPDMLYKFSQDCPTPTHELGLSSNSLKPEFSSSEEFIFVCTVNSEQLLKIQAENLRVVAVIDLESKPSDFRMAELNNSIVVRDESGVSLYSFADLKLIKKIELSVKSDCVCVSKDGKECFTRGFGNRLIKINFEDFSIHTAFQLPYNPTSMLLSDDCQKIVIANRSVDVFDLASWRLEKSSINLGMVIRNLKSINQDQYFTFTNQSELVFLKGKNFVVLKKISFSSSKLNDSDVVENILLTVGSDGCAFLSLLNFIGIHLNNSLMSLKELPSFKQPFDFCETQKQNQPVNGELICLSCRESNKIVSDKVISVKIENSFNGVETQPLPFLDQMISEKLFKYPYDKFEDEIFKKDGVEIEKEILSCCESFEKAENKNLELIAENKNHEELQNFSDHKNETIPLEETQKINIGINFEQVNPAVPTEYQPLEKETMLSFISFESDINKKAENPIASAEQAIPEDQIIQKISLEKDDSILKVLTIIFPEYPSKPAESEQLELFSFNGESVQKLKQQSDITIECFPGGILKANVFTGYGKIVFDRECSLLSEIFENKAIFGIKRKPILFLSGKGFKVASIINELLELEDGRMFLLNYENN